jgi:hypothetical protein
VDPHSPLSISCSSWPAAFPSLWIWGTDNRWENDTVRSGRGENEDKNEWTMSHVKLDQRYLWVSSHLLRLFLGCFVLYLHVQLLDLTKHNFNKQQSQEVGVLATFRWLHVTSLSQALSQSKQVSMLDHWFLLYLQLVLSLCSSTRLLCSLSGIASSCTCSRKLWRWLDLSLATASNSLDPFGRDVILENLVSYFLSSFSCFHPELVAANGSSGLSSLTGVAWLFSASYILVANRVFSCSIGPLQKSCTIKAPFRCQKFCQNFQILRHIESLNTCMKH